MKKTVCALLFILLVSASIVSAAGISNDYNGTKAFFPAVYYAIQTKLPNIPLESVDFFNNSYLTGYYETKDFLVPLRFKTRISLAAQKINISFENMQEKSDKVSIGKDPWDKIDKPLFYKTDKLKNELLSLIQDSLNNEKLWQENKAKALNNIVFVYYLMRDMNSISTQDFIVQYLSPVKITTTVEFMDAVAKTTVFNKITYKYKTTFYVSLPESEPGSLIGGKSFLITYYTNNESIARMSKHAKASISGYVSGGERDPKSNDTFLLTMVDR